MNTYFNHDLEHFRPTESEIRENISDWSTVDWQRISNEYVLDQDFIREMKGKLVKTELIDNKSIDYKLYCEIISDESFENQMNCKLAFLGWRYDRDLMDRKEIENIIRKEIPFFCDWDWHVVISLFDLSDEFIIEEMASREMWEEISSIKRLSETLLDKYTDKLIWSLVSFMHEVSPHFLQKYAEKLSPEFLKKQVYKLQSL